ncbi:MAG: hypothetical protein KatS3mg132_251 [Limisphaera sp.]|nr:MAG: hypothetical protein KatS3mg132_251 [Limisphaera sp.]
MVALFHVGLLVYAAWSDSMAGDDEGGHLVSGIWHWQSGEFDLYRVNPPLVRLWACWPVREVAAEQMPAWVEEAFQVRRPEFVLMSRFVHELGWEAQRLLFRARLMVVALSLLGLWICWRWARALFGARAGLLSAMLWCVGAERFGTWPPHHARPGRGGDRFGSRICVLAVVQAARARPRAGSRSASGAYATDQVYLDRTRAPVAADLVLPLPWAGISGRARALEAGDGADGGDVCHGLAGPPCGIRL